MNELFSHIRAILYRNFLWACRSPFRLSDVIIWPLVMLFTLTFFLSTVGGDTHYLGLLILAVIGWRAIFFVSFETLAIFIEEHWDQALPNLLVSPISPLMISIGGALTGILKAVAVMLLCLGAGYFLYDFSLGEPLLFLVALGFLMLTGFSVGFMLFGMSCYFDKRNIFTLSFLFPELIGLLSGPYYDIWAVFPEWIAAILNTFPSTHAFNVIKSIFGFAEADYTMLLGTTVLWLVLAVAINRLFYDMGRRKGTLTKLG